MNERQGFPSWILWGACLLPLIYLPTLQTGFDFVDDGNLVYPSPAADLSERLSIYWQKVVANFEHLGPFRPVLWAHWETEANLFAADPFVWRLARLLWCGLATAVLLWLLWELRIRPAVALGTAALVMWNPYRNEIWTSLTLAEGVAMPYALASLACAARASRSSRAWLWDLASVLCVLAALGCKNVFAALVPAQILLRVWPIGVTLREGLRQHGWRASLLGLSLLLPIAHFVYFKLHPHPHHYRPGLPTWEQFGRIASGLRGAESLEFVGLGLVIALIGLVAARGVRSGLLAIWEQHRPAVIAGLALLTAGICVYLPMSMISGRYTMPAVWGLDLLLAAMLATALTQAATMWRHLAVTALTVGLLGVAVASVGKQEKFQARAGLLWTVVESLERDVPPEATVAWVSRSQTGRGPDALNTEEGIHVAWHLKHRGATPLQVGLVDEAGDPTNRCEIPELTKPATHAITAGSPPPWPGDWHIVREFAYPYWGQSRAYKAVLWQRRSGSMSSLLIRNRVALPS